MSITSLPPTVSMLEKFMLDSNIIEGEPRINPKDIPLADEVCTGGIQNLEHIKSIHKRITNHLDVTWSGKWRTVGVRVGSYVPPPWTEVPELMLQFWNNFETMDSWEAHNAFERIHPFQDFNGRMGRLIWLSKAFREEHYSFRIPFLQYYYYQTLRNYENLALKK